MTLLILGLLLWVGGHIWHRLVPGFYKGLGKAGYGVSAVIILASLAAMIFGYRGAAFIPIWTPPGVLTGLNNLLMIAAFYTYLTTATRTGVVWLTGNLRHPQLTGFKIWAFAHLLVNGDLASILLFGGLLGWAVLEVILINRQIRAGLGGQGGDILRDSAPITNRFVHLALVAVVFVIVASLHIWAGVIPFGG